MSAAVLGLSVPGQEKTSALSAGFNFSSCPAKNRLTWACLCVVCRDTMMSSARASMNTSSNSPLAVEQIDSCTCSTDTPCLHGLCCVD